jgi:hypothetical protein
VFGIGLKSIAIPHGFITGGISGLTLLSFTMSAGFCHRVCGICWSTSPSS